MKKTTFDKIVIAICILGMLLIGAIVLSSCKGCKKPAPPIENVVDIIEQSTQPAIDSLKQVNSLLADSIVELNLVLAKQKKQTSVAENNATATMGKLKDALAAKDTGKIIVYSEDAANEFNVFKEQVSEQDSIQEQIINTQAATIQNNRAEIQLHESKYNLLKTAYQVKEIEANDWKESANKLDRKLKKKKFWNGVWKIGTAAGVALAGIMFL
jgi:hypothetical protein